MYLKFKHEKRYVFQRPHSNTGVLNTGFEMYGNSENLHNSLSASIDWIAFTSTIIPNMKEMAEFLGCRECDFLLLPRGANGYKKMYRLIVQDASNRTTAGPIGADGRTQQATRFRLYGERIFMTIIKTFVSFGSHLLRPAVLIFTPVCILADLINDHLICTYFIKYKNFASFDIICYTACVVIPNPATERGEPRCQILLYLY